MSEEKSVVVDAVDFVEAAPVEDVVVSDERVVDSGLKTYNVQVGSADHLGMGMISEIIRIARDYGGELTPGSVPFMRFPHRTHMTVTSATPPMPSASVRVFEADTKREIFADEVKVVTVAAKFSMSEDGEESVRYTKEQLDAMDWETEFKAVCKADGITGRSRDKMTKEYLAKVE